MERPSTHRQHRKKSKNKDRDSDRSKSSRLAHFDSENAMGSTGRRKKGIQPSPIKIKRDISLDNNDHDDHGHNRDTRKNSTHKSKSGRNESIDITLSDKSTSTRRKKPRVHKKKRQSLKARVEKIERERGILFVFVEKARYLMVDRKKGYSNFIATVSSTYNKQRFSTPVAKKTDFPIWNVEFNFITLRLDGMINIKIYSKGKFQKLSSLGDISIDISQLGEGYVIRKWFKIRNEPKKKPDDLPSGEVLISFYYEGQIENNYNDDLFENHYQLEEEIGTGGFCTVYKCKHKKTNILYAVKIIDKNVPPLELELLNREIEIMKSLKSNYIIALEDVFETDRHIYLVIEYAPVGELFNEIVSNGIFEEAIAASIIKQILKGVAYLHKNGIAHRDLKPENLLITKKKKSGYVIKISDFGLSKDFDKEQLRTSCGTPDYVAPEVLLGMTYDNSVDIWSIGVIAYILLSGFPPFYGDDDQEVFGRILQADYSFPSPDWDGVSDYAKQFVSAVLKLNFNNRPNAEECLESPWLKFYG